MKQKLAFLKLVWNVLFRNGGDGYIFARFSKHQQLDFLSGKPVDINMRYIQVDGRVVGQFMDKLTRKDPPEATRRRPRPRRNLHPVQRGQVFVGMNYKNEEGVD